MKSVEALSAILGIAMVSGVNLYAAILTLGLGLRFGWISGLPPELAVVSHPAVLVAAGVFYLAEFVADKIPFFTPIWDGVHTVIRPIGAAMLAFGAASEMSPLAQIAAVLFAGSIALGTHSTKMGVRLLAHAAPEPGTHSLLSVGEDIGVVALLLLAYQHPYIALPILVALLVAMILVLPLLLRILRFIVACCLGRLMSFGADADPSDVPAWVQEQAGRATPVRLFARKGRLPRLSMGYLVGEHFLHKSWFRVRRRPVGDLSEATITRGLFAEVILLADGTSFYLTKEWRKCWAERGGAGIPAGAARIEPVPLQDSAKMS
ncbi:MAG: DUF4126 domain-containing protein [Acidobacteriota bacterium]